MKHDKYKAIDKQLMWWNGTKWLVKETCKSKKEANELLKELENEQQ